MTYIETTCDDADKCNNENFEMGQRKNIEQLDTTNPKRKVGIERERFIVDPKTGRKNPVTGEIDARTCQIVSRIDDLLPEVWKVADERRIPRERFMYEGYAGQIEDKTDPFTVLDEIRRQLIENDMILDEAASKLGLAYDFTEYVEEERLENLNCNTINERHIQLWKEKDREKWILPVCRIIGVHVNIETTDDETVKIFKQGRPMIDSLCRIGDHSDLKRVKTWDTIMQRPAYPPSFNNYEEILTYTRAKGGAKNVWDLIRYKPDLQVTEFRMFGATPSVDEVIDYIRKSLGVIV